MPGLQALHKEAPVALENQPALHMEQEVLPADDWLNPAAQSRHTVPEGEAYFPSLHWLQAIRLISPVTDPEGHGRHSLLDEPPQALVAYDPAAQVVQTAHLMSSLLLQSTVL